MRGRAKTAAAARSTAAELPSDPRLLQFSLDAGATFVVDDYAWDGKPLLHYHSSYELTLTRGSVGRRIVGDNTAVYGDGDLVLLGPNLVHTWVADSITGGSGHNVAIVFTRESLCPEFLARKEFESIVHMLDRSELGLHFRGEAAAAAGAAMERLRSLSSAERILSLFSILNTLAGARSVSTLVSKDYAPSAQERDYGKLSRVIARLHDDTGSKLALQEAARICGMSISSFSRFFKKMTGKTLIAYENEWRISTACSFLREEKRSVLDIAYAVGYGNLSHFNRQFLRLRGVTPSEYRARLKAGGI